MVMTGHFPDVAGEDFIWESSRRSHTALNSEHARSSIPLGWGQVFRVVLRSCLLMTDPGPCIAVGRLSSEVTGHRLGIQQHQPSSSIASHLSHYLVRPVYTAVR